MGIGIHLAVKFRMFGITFGTVDQSVAVRFDPNTSRLSVTPAVPLPGAQVVLDQRGVLLAVWGIV